MSAKARLWIGVTLLLALAINYIIIGVPVIRRSEAIKVQMKSLVIKYAKSSASFGDMEQDYLLQIFRKEQGVLEQRILILNCASATISFFVLSWMVFGLIFRRKK